MSDDMKFILLFVSGMCAGTLGLILLAYIFTEVGFWYGVASLFVLTLIPLAIIALDIYIKVRVRWREEELKKALKRYE